MTLCIANKAAAVGTYRVIIWECRRSWFGMPMKWSLPGSKIAGYWMNRSYEQAASELEARIRAFLHLPV